MVGEIGFAFAEEGSCSTIRGDGDGNVMSLSVRACGFGFWRALSILRGGGADAVGTGEYSVGILDR